MSRYGVLLTTLLALAAPALAAPAAADTIYQGPPGSGPGTPLSGITITEVSYTGVRWRGKGGARGTVVLEQVRSLVFDNTPHDYEQGKTAFDDGRYAAAIPMFAKALRRAAADSWVIQYALWYTARCHMQLGQDVEAGKVLRDLQTKVPKTRFLPDLLVALGRINLNEGKTAGAQKVFSQLLQLTQTERSLSKSYFYTAKAWIGRCYLAGGNADKGLDSFRELRSAAGSSFPDVYLLATIGEGQALLLQKEYSQARTLFVEVITKAKPSKNDHMTFLAQAHNGLGETLYYGSDANFHKALKAFLKVVVLFGAETSEQPKALWHAAKCFHKLRVENKEFGLRSRDLRTELQQKYPRSPWASKW